MEKLNLIGTQPFETKRMKLRAFKLSDAQYIYKNWANSENVTKYLTWKQALNSVLSALSSRAGQIILTGSSC